MHDDRVTWCKQGLSRAGASPDGPASSPGDDYNKISFKEQAHVPLEEVLPDASPQALDLLGRFLLYPPLQRIAASQVGDT